MSFRSTCIVLFIALIVFKWDVLREEFSPPPDFSAQYPEGVILYSAAWCGYCNKTRAFFKENNVAFVEYDIEKSSEGRSQYEQLHGSGIPLIMIRGQVMRGYDPNALKDALQL